MFEVEYKPTLKPAEVKPHSRQLRQKSTSDPMEVGSFGRGGKKGKKRKKGKGDGKNGKKEGQHQNQNPSPSKDVVCWHCGEKSGLSTEGWSNPKNQSGSSGTENEGGKGKPKNVTGKEASSLEQGEQAAVVEPQPEPALASSLDLVSIETPVRSPHPDHEGWLRWTYDAGAAISAFPLDARTGTETPRICGCTTAGDIVKTRCSFCLRLVESTPGSSGTVGSLCFNASKAEDSEKLTNLVLTSNAFPGRPSRESVQGFVKSCLEVCAVDLTRQFSSTNVQCSLVCVQGWLQNSKTAGIWTPSRGGTSAAVT